MVHKLYGFFVILELDHTSYDTLLFYWKAHPDCSIKKKKKRERVDGE